MSIIQLSRLIKFAIFSFMIVQCTFFVLTWANLAIHFGPFNMYLSTKGLSYAELSDLSWSLRVIGASLGALPLVFAIGGMWQLNRMLSSLSTSTLFSLANIRYLQNFSAGILISTLLSILEQPLRALIFTLFTAAPMRKISVSIGAEELLLCLFCFLFYLIIQLLHAARRLEEENKEFI